MKFLLGFLLGVLFVYVIGALVAWDRNPGNWGIFWRFLCLAFGMFWGWVGGVFLKDYFRP